MRIRTDATRGIRVLACEGAMTLGGGADELGDAFEKALREGGSGIVLDLTRLSYLDSAGVGAVVSCSKHAAVSGVVMKIALGRTGPVRKIFAITQLERGFEIFDDVASAAASFE
jgi:anti-sigma B factor antagonist